MTAPRYLRHLTLDTGDQRDSYRSEVSDGVIAMLRPLLDRVAAGDHVEIPSALPRCRMHGRTVRGRGLVVTVYSADMVHPDDLLAGEHCEDYEICEFGVAPDSLASATLWRDWIGRERDDRTPTAPWCVVRMLPGIAVYPAAAQWAGDFERCVAWAHLENSPCKKQS